MRAGVPLHQFPKTASPRPPLVHLHHAALPGLRELDIDEEAALQTTRALIRKGFPVGPSTGLNFCAAEQIARELGAGAQVVTVFADRMERYFSTELFSH